MIIVNSALLQNEIILIVENIVVDGEKPFKFKNKKGIELQFDSEEINSDPCSLIKNEIKKSSFGNVLFFNVIKKP